LKKIKREMTDAAKKARVSNMISESAKPVLKVILKRRPAITSRTERISK
jgi:hypothetical protein